MRVFPIQTTNFSKAQGSKSVKNSSNVNFQGNYYQTYLSALTRELRNGKDAQALYKDLLKAAKSESGLITNVYTKILDEPTLIGVLRRARSNRKNVNELLSSTNYPSPLITLEDDEVAFHHPTNGIFGAGNIVFYYKDDYEVVVYRPKDYHRFYSNGVLKETYLKAGSAGIMDHKHFNRDGSPNYFKDFFSW